MGKVQVYGKNTCPECVMLVKWLDQRRISLEYNDVTKYPEIAEELYLKSGNATLPQYYYEGNWYKGFNIQKLQQIFRME